MTKLFLFMVSLFIYTGASAESYNASFADKYGKKHGVYHSQPVNLKVQGLTSNDEKMHSDLANYYSVSNFDYKCPGYSFVVGIKSIFQEFDKDIDTRKHNADRDFSFSCAFLEDNKDRLIRKTNCVSPKSPDNKNEKKGLSQCNKKGQFIQGFSSIRYRKADENNEIENKFFNDRLNKSSCCELEDFDGNNLTFASCETHSFPAKEDFQFTCKSGMILKEIETTFHNETSLWDRNYSFTCCKATTED